MGEDEDGVVGHEVGLGVGDASSDIDDGAKGGVALGEEGDASGDTTKVQAGVVLPFRLAGTMQDE
jgi:hypothetical protein